MSAYNHLGLKPDQRRFGVIIVPDRSGRLAAGVANCALFGSSIVVCGFCTLSTVSATFSRRTLGIASQAYIDDFASPHRDNELLHRRVDQHNRFRRAQGTIFDKAKHQLSSKVRYFGMVIEFILMCTAILISVCPIRKSKLISTMKKILDAGVLSVKEAEILAGRLNFAAMGNKTGRAFLGSIYAHARGRGGKISKRLRQALGWLIRALEAEADTIVYTDNSLYRQRSIWPYKVYDPISADPVQQWTGPSEMGSYTVIDQT